MCLRAGVPIRWEPSGGNGTWDIYTGHRHGNRNSNGVSDNYIREACSQERWDFGKCTIYAIDLGSRKDLRIGSRFGTQCTICGTSRGCGTHFRKSPNRCLLADSGMVKRMQSGNIARVEVEVVEGGSGGRSREVFV